MLKIERHGSLRAFTTKKYKGYAMLKFVNIIILRSYPSMIRSFYLILLGVFLSGCAAQTELMNGIMSSWQGAQITEVVSQWGPPHERIEVGGVTYYTWHHNKNAMIAPGMATTSGSAYTTVAGKSALTTGSTTTTYTPPSVFYGACDRLLGVDSNERVVSWNWGGNNCPFMALMEYSTWRKR
jgi:hypothetical protein